MIRLRRSCVEKRIWSNLSFPHHRPYPLLLVSKTAVVQNNRTCRCQGGEMLKHVWRAVFQIERIPGSIPTGISSNTGGSGNQDTQEAVHGRRGRNHPLEKR